MLVRPAEESYRRGVEALMAGKTLQAMALFEAAIELERKYGVTRPQARYLSYYGLCLGSEGGRRREGVRFCREATQLEFYNPDLYLNLGRVLLSAGDRRAAHAALIDGYRLQPGHPAIVREMKRMGLRRRPPIPFLARGNPLNVLLGRLTRGGTRPRDASEEETGEAGSGTPAVQRS